MAKNFSINEAGQFIIENYQNKPSFASFLPGIAGKLGIPMWAFYVNRGQGIASFGVESKDNSIMEFYPANKSYANVSTKGFRSFIKIDGEFYEPFKELNNHITTQMIIEPDHLTIVEENNDLNIRTKIMFYVLPKENFAGLVRKVEIINLSDTKRSIEVLDGLPVLIPYGIDHETLKNGSQTITAWAKVYNLENSIPFYRLSATANDEAQVDEITAGNFYIAKSNITKGLIQPIVDPQIIFDYDESLSTPHGFINGIRENQNQITENQFPCGMSRVENTVDSNESIVIESIIGNVASEEILESIGKKVLEKGFFDKKYTEMVEVHQLYSDLSFTHSGDERFNGYVKQNFLDNILRGGIPIEVGEENKKIYHIFSRKHGDLERDYNAFSLEPRYFSQGNGNYRDVNQNRRSDLFFNSKVKSHNVKTFFNLITLEGFNPLVINGQKFKVEDLEALKKIEDESLVALVTKPYSLGELYEHLEKCDYNQLEMNVLANKIIDQSESILVSSFDEGYWVDHWTYNLDLIENFLRVYPDKLTELFLKEDYKYYDSFVRILPRNEKYQLTVRGPRQYDALVEDEEKKRKNEERKKDKNFLRVNGKVYKSNLVEKIFVLLLNKIASLDPYGLGIEMEANKPGWYDALNGLPGLFGSSFGETAEVYKWTQFILETLKELDFESIEVLEEVSEFYNAINDLLIKWQADQDHFSYWDQSTSVKENYREKIFYENSGVFSKIAKASLIEFFENIQEKLLYSIQESKQDTGLYTMFYSYEAIDYDETGKVSEEGLPFVKVNAFKKKPLSNFLEGQVKAHKIIASNKEAEKLHENVKKSDLYDEKLKMFRVNGVLEDESFEIGRAKAFTPGWLENGSIWLHMEYKYLLELLKHGLYETFIESFNNAGVLYQDPNTYKRSIFENSSFILSSLNSDTNNHGRGYIARLSGATAEFIDMWTRMSFGEKPFKVDDDLLVFEPKPILTKKMFTKTVNKKSIQLENERVMIELPEKTYSARFLGQALVIYHNQSLKDTFGKEGVSAKSYKLIYKDNHQEIVKNHCIVGEKAEDIREGLVKEIHITLN